MIHRVSCLTLFLQKSQKYVINNVIRKSNNNNMLMLIIRKKSSEIVTKTIEFIHENEPMGQFVIVQGWIKTIRKHKETTFIDLYDGTCNKVLQVIGKHDERLGLSNGCSVKVEGKIKPSPYPKQKLEMEAENITVIGSCDPETFPLPVKTKFDLNYLRSFLHLRPRSRIFSSILKIRNVSTMALHKYFQNKGFNYIHTPILTSNDAEGAGDVFQVQRKKVSTENETDSEEENLSDVDLPLIDSPKDLSVIFDHDVYLTVSGQLQLEAMVCGSLPKVYSFGPIFRGENTSTRRHLSEFYMLEAEIAFIEHLDEILLMIEDMIKKTAEEIYQISAAEFHTIDKYYGVEHMENIKKLLKNDFVRISYSDAIALLNKKQNPSLKLLTWGMNLKRKHEQELVKLCGNLPVFLTDFPSDLKAFYMKCNKDQKTVAAVDLLVPEIGELCGGSLREDRLAELQKKVNDKSGNLTWYLELRQFGSVPHGGFGLGFERYLRFITGIYNIRDTIPFPRWPHHCSM